MEDFWLQITTWWTAGGNTSLGRALLVLVVGLIVVRASGAAVSRVLEPRASAQHAMIARRVTVYGLATITVIAALNELGFDLSVLVGAAGILTVAIGFASKTAASNVISGLFLMGEKPFVLGDTIDIGSFSGEVTAIDLLSVKIRTFDNRLVRVPNESMLTKELININKLPIRRFDMRIRVGFGEDIDTIRELLMALAEREPLCLDSPAPVFNLEGFGESGLELMFAAWTTRQNYLAHRNAMVEGAARALAAAGIQPTGAHRKLIFDAQGPKPSAPDQSC